MRASLESRDLPESSAISESAALTPSTSTATVAVETPAEVEVVPVKLERKGSIFGAIGRYAGTVLASAASVGSGGRKKVGHRPQI